MCKVLLALVLLNVAFFMDALPVNDSSSVYNVMKSHSAKCPYLQATVLKTEPEFLKPCTNFNRIASIAAVIDDNINDVRCTIYYNSMLLLCLSVNLTQEEIAFYFIDKEKMEANLKTNTVDTACQALKKEEHQIETVQKSMNTILPLLQSDQICHKICADFTNQLYPACNEAAYMVQVMFNHNNNKSNRERVNAALALKSNTSSHAGPQEAQSTPTKIDHAQPKEAQIQESKTLNNISKPDSAAPPEQMKQQLDPTISRNDTQMQLNKTTQTAKKSEEPQETRVSSEIKASNGSKLVDGKGGQMEVENPLEKPNEVKNVVENGTKLVKSENKPAESENKSVESENKPIDSRNNPIETPEKSESTATAKKEPVMPEKSSPVGPEKEETVVTAPEIEQDTFESNEEGARPEEYQDFGQETKQEEEDIKKTEEAKQPEVNKQPEGKHKTPKPEETIDEDLLLSASYNQHMDEDDSYFFTYFMMVCVIFVLAYVAYHNKQKVFALVLEGRRGRRPSRSRRPNSANYHKLDSNLEEAVTSACNKNTTHIIY